MKPIIVGIDGSPAAIAAALWGVDEAISRAVPLRLIAGYEADTSIPGRLRPRSGARRKITSRSTIGS